MAVRARDAQAAARARAIWSDQLGARRQMTSARARDACCARRVCHAQPPQPSVAALGLAFARAEDRGGVRAARSWGSPVGGAGQGRFARSAEVVKVRDRIT